MRLRFNDFLPVRFAALLFLLVGGTGALVAGAASPAAGKVTDAELQTMLRDYIDGDKLAVGLAVGMVDERGSRVICHGKLDNGTDREVDGDTLFGLGSVTKVFTVLLLQDMVERGEMKLEEPAQKFLPDSLKLPTYQGKQITLLHLATHTSGLPRDAEGGVSLTLSRCKLGQAPGTRWGYSNLGMALLAHALTRQAGKDYESLLLERICRPLGMDSTRLGRPPELEGRVAVGHAIPGYRPRVLTGRPGFPGAGGVFSTVNDLLKFVSAYAGLTPSPLSSLFQKAQAVHTLEDGSKRRLAWGGTGPVFEHGGLVDDYEAELLFDIEKRRGLVVLSSCANWSTLVPTLRDQLLDGPSPKPIQTAALDPKVYDGYLGQYRADERSAIITVRRENNRLMVQSRDHLGDRYLPSFEIFPKSDTVFRNEFLGWEATFIPGEQGQPLKLQFRSLTRPDRVEFSRFSTALPPRPALVHVDSQAYEACVGQYRKTFLLGLLQFGPTLSISHFTDRAGDHLLISVRGLPGYSAAEFFPVTQTRFVVNPTAAPDDIRLTFVPGRQGKASGVRVYWNGKELTGTRIAGEPAK